MDVIPTSDPNSSVGKAEMSYRSADCIGEERDRPTCFSARTRCRGKQEKNMPYS